MHILITGAAGMIGSKLTERLVMDQGLDNRPVERLSLLDIVQPERPKGFSDHVKARAGDLAEPGVAEKVVAGRPDVIFHLAGVVSGEAETNFDKGYRANLDGMRALLEAIRKIGGGYKPRLVFTSSMAVYGAPFHNVIDDEFHLTPLTSYGTQKMMCEAMLADYTRKGYVEGVGIRLPSIVVRPGKPNKAASGFFSGIIREPLNGEEAQLPVSESVVHTHASPRSAIGFLVHAAELARDRIEPHVNITMPGVSCTVGEQIEALKRVAGDKVAARIRRQPDELVMRIVSGWPHRLSGKRARELGFRVEESFDEIIRVHIDEDRGGSFVK
jgi:nucleoside-diphosphate-sugar epimerase